MFYIIKDNKLNSYADYKYDDNCLETSIITQVELDAHPNKVIVQDGVLVINPNYDVELLAEKREAKNNENTSKAQEAIQDGYVVFKEAQFETNTQTCSDLTSTMLIMQAGGIESYDWLSKDDKVVTLTLADFGTLGGLIATYKNQVWNVKYLGYKQQITNAQTVAELDAIVIDYDVPTILEGLE